MNSFSIAHVIVYLSYFMFVNIFGDEMVILFIFKILNARIRHA